MFVHKQCKVNQSGGDFGLLFSFFLHCLSDSLPQLRSQEALRLLPLRQTSAVFFMILRLAPHYGFCTSILNLGSAIYDFLKTPNKDNHNSQLSNVNFSLFLFYPSIYRSSKGLPIAGLPILYRAPHTTYMPH